MEQYEAAIIIKEAYEKGDFSRIFPVMADDYEHMSFWVLEVIRGKDAAIDYYQGKGETIRKNGSFAEGVIVEIIDAPTRVRPHGVFVNGERIKEDDSFYNRKDRGKIAVMLTQKLDEDIRTLAIPSIDDHGKLRQILITDPDLYELLEK